MFLFTRSFSSLYRWYFYICLYLFGRFWSSKLVNRTTKPRAVNKIYTKNSFIISYLLYGHTGFDNQIRWADLQPPTSCTDKNKWHWNGSCVLWKFVYCTYFLMHLQQFFNLIEIWYIQFITDARDSWVNTLSSHRMLIQVTASCSTD